MPEAQAWEQSDRSGGHQPWHLDARATALAFTTGYLGYADINKVGSVTVDAGGGAHIAVGFRPEASAFSAAAVIHLIRLGNVSNAPWEVVGTDDTTLSLTTPVYGAAAGSPVTVGGRITGVDEHITIQVRQPSSATPLGQSPGVAAGGSNAPWASKVAYSGATDSVLTIAASTGGHVQAHERFAVTAITH